MNELAQLDRAERRVRRRLAALAFLDVVGYSRLVAADEETTVLAWSRLRDSVIEPRVITWRGRIVDRAGDAIFVEFGSALEALCWAVEVQNAAKRHPHPTEPFILRIALHLADVIDGRDGEVQGDGVNTAARLQTYAEAGGIIASKAVVDAVQGKTEAVFVDLGQLTLKNLKYPVHAFRLGVAPATVSMVRKLQWPAYIAFGAIGLSLTAFISLSDWRTSWRDQADFMAQLGLSDKCPTFPCPAEARKVAEQEVVVEAQKAIEQKAAAEAKRQVEQKVAIETKRLADQKAAAEAAQKFAEQVTARRAALDVLHRSTVQPLAQQLTSDIVKNPPVNASVPTQSPRAGETIAGNGPYDGSYAGGIIVINGSVPVCGSTKDMTVTVKDSKLEYSFGPTRRKVALSLDGIFHDQYETGSGNRIRSSAKGHVFNSILEADFAHVGDWGPVCSFHWSLKKQ